MSNLDLHPVMLSDEDTFLDLPDLPGWRVRITAIVPQFPLKAEMVGVAVWFAKVERQKKDGSWHTTVSGLNTYENPFNAMLGAAAALQKVRASPRKVRAGIVRPFDT